MAAFPAFPLRLPASCVASLKCSWITNVHLGQTGTTLGNWKAAVYNKASELCTGLCVCEILLHLKISCILFIHHL